MADLKLELEGRAYAVSGDMIRGTLLGRIPELLREVEHLGAPGVAITGALRVFLPFITSRNAAATGRTPPDYKALRKNKQDVTLACLEYWFDDAWVDLCKTSWDIDTKETDYGATQLTGLHSAAPTVVAAVASGTDTGTAAGDAHSTAGSLQIESAVR